MADMGKMHTDLMRPPGFEPAFDKRRKRFIRRFARPKGSSTR
jgi:hypothetical protein